MPVLHQMQMSGNCSKVRLASHQLGIPLTLKEYPLLAGGTRKPEFLAKNPNGRVLLLELANGRCLLEYGAILWYLSEGHVAATERQLAARADALLNVL